MFTGRTWILIIVVAVLLGSIVIDFSPVAKFVGIPNHFSVHTGLDIKGGVRLVYQTDLTNIPEENQPDAVNGVVDVIRRRIDALGVSEPSIQKTTNNSQVIVELPGISDINQAISLIGKTAELEFREAIPGQSIDESNNLKSPKYEDWKEMGLTGAQFQSAKVDLQSGSGAALVQEPVIRIQFNEEGGKIFGSVTSRNVGKPVAIFLDKELLSAPRVQNPITDGTGIISGGFNLDQAKTLAIQLNAGALPVPIKIVSQTNVGPTLGMESVNHSVVAGILGLLLVVLFMLLYYRLPGLVAALALLYYSLVVLGLFIYIPVTLSLAGMAGFILSVGMAVDANILIFERMKEEVAAGRSLLASIDSGVRRAWSSIRDSNISSMITAFVLFWFGSGLVKGFALTLGLGIIVSMFTAITVSSLLLRGLAQTGLANSSWLWGFKTTKK